MNVNTVRAYSVGLAAMLVKKNVRGDIALQRCAADELKKLRGREMAGQTQWESF